MPPLPSVLNAAAGPTPVGTDPSMAGVVASSPSMLFDPQAMDRERTRDLLMGLASGFLQAGAPSRVPIDFGTAFGSALQNGQQATAGSDERVMRQAMARAQLQQLHAVNQMLPTLIAGATNSQQSGQQPVATTPSGTVQTSPLPPPNFGNVVANGNPATGQPGESGGNYAAVNPQSGAFGKYQFTPDTWATVATKNPQLGLPFDMRQATPEQQETAFGALTQANAQGLRTLGIQPTPGNLYLAHRFGPQGTSTFLQAQDNTPIAQVFPAQWIAQNPDLQNKTVGQFKAETASRFGSSGPQMPGAPPDPSRWAALSLLPQFAPFAQAMMKRDQAAYEDSWKRYNANQDLLKNQSAIANQPVTPTGGVNPSVVAAAAAKQSAEQKAKIQGEREAEYPPEWQGKTGDELRQVLPQNVRTIVDQLHSGELAMSDLPTRLAASTGAPSKVDYVALTKQMDPDWEPRIGEQRKNFETEISDPAKNLGATRFSLGTAYQHLDQYQDLMVALGNHDAPMVNKLLDAWNTQKGNEKFTNARALQHHLATEVARVVKGGNQLNEADIESGVGNLSTAASLPQAAGTLQVWRHAMDARWNTIADAAKSINIPQSKIDGWLGQSAVKARDHFDQVQASVPRSDGSTGNVAPGAISLDAINAELARRQQTGGR